MNERRQETWERQTRETLHKEHINNHNYPSYIPCCSQFYFFALASLAMAVGLFLVFVPCACFQLPSLIIFTFSHVSSSTCSCRAAILIESMVSSNEQLKWHECFECAFLAPMMTEPKSRSQSVYVSGQRECRSAFMNISWVYKVDEDVTCTTVRSSEAGDLSRAALQFLLAAGYTVPSWRRLCSAQEAVATRFS